MAPEQSSTTGTNSRSGKSASRRRGRVQRRGRETRAERGETRAERGETRAKRGETRAERGTSGIIPLPRIASAHGNLTFIEGGNHIPFEVRRVYFLYDVPAGAERGGHAHKELCQLIIPLAGSFDVLLDDGYRREVHRLDRPYLGLLIAPGMWRELSNFTSGSVCLVLASAPYDEADYLRDYAAFIRAARKAA